MQSYSPPSLSLHICAVQNKDIISITMKNLVVPKGEMILAMALVQYKMTEN